MTTQETGTNAASYPSEAEVRSRSVGDIVGDIQKDLSTLVHQEIELAKAEAKQEVAKAGKAAGMLGGAAFAGYMVAVFVSFACVFLIGTFWSEWVGSLIVTAVWGIAGAVLYRRGRQQLQDVSGPRQTVETLKEDAAWARHPTS